MSTPVDYAIAAVTMPVAVELRREVAQFWLQNGAIGDAREAQRRADELVCVARNGIGEIVGVNTAFLGSLRPGAERCFLFRMFLRRQERCLRLALGMMRAAVAELRVRREAEPSIRSVALVAENQKLMRRGGQRLLVGLGWRLAGRNARGQDMWTFAFDGTVEIGK